MYRAEVAEKISK